MLKVVPHHNYPPEEGRYLRGNDGSPVAVAVVLNCDDDKIPRELVILVRAGIESGAALAGTVQTENIGFEKIICNIVANPNIRYMVIGGPESEGHRVGEALEALLVNGVDEKKRIIGASAPHPILHNVPMEMIERFCKQVSPIQLQFESDPDLIRRAVWSCYQEEPVEFRGYHLYDPGAYPEPAMSGEITWRVTSPFGSPLEEGEEAAREKAREMIERLKSRNRETES
ncbi:MAG: tetrahydromethanopterin S-methyltransferase subunit A [Dehalococcoidales bacterium]|nr:MAG: tetrahydromethanopterin S-methyltransferase subunit A [Dehalococcoidales bacterium]